MGLSGYKEDLIVRYNHIIKKRITFKQKTSFIRSLMTEFKHIESYVKVVELREKGKKTSIARNVYVGDVKNADVIIATYYDSPLMHLGPYYVLDKKKQSTYTLLFNAIMSISTIVLGVSFTFFVTNKYFVSGFENINWPMFIIFGVLYMLLVYLISIFSKGVGRNKNLIRNNATVIYVIEKIMNHHKENKKVAFAFLDSGTTNENGLYALKESAKDSTKIIYLDSISSSEKLYCVNNGSVEELMEYTRFKKEGVYKIFSAVKNNGEYYLTLDHLNARDENEQNIIYVDSILNRLIN